MKLYPVVVQDVLTRDVLMLAYANAAALRKTRQSGFGWFYSRSRKKLWKKGQTSGNTLRVKKITWDCDQDALLYSVIPNGPSCHTGKDTCFGPKPFSLETLRQQLEKQNQPRNKRRRKNSYTVKLLDKPWLLAEKLAEEGAELGEARFPKETVWEAADVLYFTLVKLIQQKVPFKIVLRELKRRNKLG